jgi:hypothetical protein
VWLNAGNSIDEAKKLFWNALEKEISKRYELQPIQAVDKLSMATELSMKKDGVRLTRKGNKLFIVDVEKLTRDVMNYKMSGGYFFQYSADSLDDIVPIMGKMCQTVAVFGIDKRSVVGFVL